ncbi:MAG: MASE4 domain-containing protein [Solirubrobacterales bacterium]
MPMFVGVYQTAVIIGDLLTAVLIVNHFIDTRSAGTLILACGYLLTSMLAAVQLASFPNVFAPSGIIGGDHQTPPLLWASWHAAFPISALGFALVGRTIRMPVPWALAIGVAVTLGIAAAITVTCTQFTAHLPAMIADRDFSPFFLGRVYPALTGLCLAAIAALALSRRTHSVLTLYLALALLAFMLDVVNNWHSGARYALGWYLGRANSFLASVLLCCLFIIENARLVRYANQAASTLRSLNAALVAANSAKSRFFAAASHDLRQPFQAMRLFYTVLEAQSTPSPALARLGLAMHSAETLLNELLDVAKLEAGELRVTRETVDLGVVIAEITAEMTIVAAQKGLAIRSRAAPTAVETDRVLLKRILFNLISNAIRYTARGGILVGLRKRGGMTVIEVWDTGIGIAPADADRVFEEFYQVENPSRDRSQGLGLGLSIVKRLSDVLGCEVTMASRPGTGTVFRVAIPQERLAAA